MTVEYIDVTLQMTVQQTLDKIRTIGIHSETVYTCYVVEKRKLMRDCYGRSIVDQ